MNVQTRRQWHQLTVDNVLVLLEARREGLSDEGSKRRLEQFGPNELSVEGRALPLAILLRQVQSPLIYILVAAGVATLLLGKYVDAVVILSVVILNSAVGFIQEYKAERSLRALARMTAPKARVLRDGKEREIDAREVVPGDIVILESGMKVPADLRLFRVVAVHADESILTGESQPAAKTIEPVADTNAPPWRSGQYGLYGNDHRAGAWSRRRRGHGNADGNGAHLGPVLASTAIRLAHETFEP